jgi:hypothetical protein
MPRAAFLSVDPSGVLLPRVHPHQSSTQDAALFDVVPPCVNRQKEHSHVQ